MNKNSFKLIQIPVSFELCAKRTPANNKIKINETEIETYL